MKTLLSKVIATLLLYRFSRFLLCLFTEALLRKCSIVYSNNTFTIESIFKAMLLLKIYSKLLVLMHMYNRMRD
jgi:hypothetical protein